MNDPPAQDVEIFAAAIELPVAERLAYLDRACRSEAELRQRVEALLREHDGLGDFLEKPPPRPATPGGESAVSAKSGDRIGRYKLLKQIGEGGCGVVYLAEQETPVKRQVALKLIRPGMDTKSVIARFEAERQVLALMDHPNIAKVFDAGETKSGRPYFVMELVQGVKITDYCDQHSLTTEHRLRLFVQVCQAVQHAHQKGIIHRDIKPSNILVAQSEAGAAVPMVIDFGIAKATTNQRLSDATVFTAIEMLIGTPAYMSPEQAALTSADVDTRTDIYSLGVLLYELLTGTTPFETRELLKIGIDEVRRVIREEEPIRPSTRLTTMTAAELLSISKHHGMEAPKLIREMRGDLDWIVMKALEKERSRRYATVNGLAMDINGYLAGEPVLARPPSRLYTFRKLVARHKLEFAALGIVMATLVAGLSSTIWSQSKALTEAKRSQQVTKFLQRILTGVDPVIAQGRDTKLLQAVLDKAVEEMGLELTNQPAVLADLKLTIGKTYGDIGQGDTGERLVREALAYYRESPRGAERQISDAFLRLSAMHMLHANTLHQAELEAREALDIETMLQGGPSMRLVQRQTQLAWVIVRMPGKEAAAEQISREALVTGQRLVGGHPEQLLDTRAVLATAFNLQGKFDLAESLLRESLSIGQEKLGPEHPNVVNDLYRLGHALERHHNYEEAEKYARQCLTLRRKVLGVDHPFYDLALNLLAKVLDNAGKQQQAADVCWEQLGLRRKHFGDKDTRVQQTAINLAGLLEASHDELQFEQLAGEFPQAWFWRSENSARHCRWRAALEAASKYLQIEPDDHQSYHLVALLLVQTGDRSAYEELCQRITTRFAGATDPYTADRMAKDCLILPRPGADLKVPAELAQTAVTRGQGDLSCLPYFQFCKALAEYRLGNWEGATNWATRAAANSLRPTAVNWFPYVRAQAYAILAMAQFQLKHAQEARDALNKCTKVVQTELLQFADKDLGDHCRDLIIVHALQSEAKRLIEGETSSAARTANVPQ